MDERRVNLTRFPLFFPEKRDFFLEDSGNFFFGSSSGGGQDVIPFFSRRIGLDEDGEEVPILAAAKWTGQTDDFSFGVLDVQTEESGELDSKNLAALRFSKNLGEQSDAGLIWTHGNPTGDLRNDTYGVDWNYRTSGFRGDENLRVSSYFLHADTEGEDEDEFAYHLGMNYPNDEVELRADYTVVEENFDPALGFVRRTGVKKYSGRFAYSPRQYSDVRRLEFSFRPTLFTGSDNDLETLELDFQPLGIEWESGESLSFRVDKTREVLDEDFEIMDDVVIEAGRHDYTRYGARFETSSKRPVSAELDLSAGEFFDGRRWDAELELDWRPGAWGLFGLEYERNEVDLEDGDFDVNIGRLRANFLFSPDVSWSNFVQYDDVSESLGLNSRLWYIFEPGRELFFVVNQGWEANADTIAPTATEVSVKFGYTLRF